MKRRVLAALALALLFAFPVASTPPTAHAASCTGWPSTRVPPASIRVLRTATGKVQVVDFKTYVQVVLAAEWPSTWPIEAIKVGAVAVKQYAWYYAMHWRGGTASGGCYDVSDSTSDQLYQPETRHPAASTLAAVDATWTESVTKNGSFVLMGYRSGAFVACGADADGWHIYEHSSLACANAGMSADQIIAIYFNPGAAFWRPAPQPWGVPISPPEQSTVTVGTSAKLSWVELPASGTTIVSRHVSLLMGIPLNGSCAVDRWVPAASPWQSGNPSLATVTGLVPGRCYRVVVTLTDSAAATTNWQSGYMYVDPAAPTAAFTSPAPDTITALTGTSATVRWTETLAPGTHLISRLLVTERAAQPAAGTCAGGIWGTLASTNAPSPIASSGLTRLYCYRYRLILTDSAGHKSTTVSGILMGLPS